MMHHTKFFKRWLAQPRLLLRTVLLGMLLTGCFAAMAGLGASMASAQSSPGQNRPHTRPNQGNQDQGNPRGQASPTAQASPAIAGSNLSGAGAPPPAPGAAGASGTGASGTGGGGGGAGGTGGGGTGGGGGGAGRPGLPSAGSDPGNNPLP